MSANKIGEIAFNTQVPQRFSRVERVTGIETRTVSLGKSPLSQPCSVSCNDIGGLN